ncbi:MAG TPA: hypothetical protein VNO30_01990 [Kofleriaceae bacterium]|nr:hypothetical protein [Kofleriaceae bacterium]
MDRRLDVLDALDALDALRDDKLDAPAAREILERAGDVPREALQAIVRDEAAPRVARRLAIRRLLETEAGDHPTLGAFGELTAVDAWLEPGYVRPVSVVGGKLPVQWLAEDTIVSIDALPAAPGDGDPHRLLVYLRIAGQPELEDVLRGLGGAATGGQLAVREIGFSEPEPPRAATGRGPAPRRAPGAPTLGSIMICRRALCDAQNGMHTLVDVLVEIPLRLPASAIFDIYLQLRDIIGPATITIQILGPRPPGGDGDGELLTTGTLTLGHSADGPADGPADPPPPALGVAIPNVTVGFEYAGEHRLRVLCGDDVLGEHRFGILDRSTLEASS